MIEYRSPEAEEMIIHFEGIHLNSYIFPKENKATIGIGCQIPMKEHPKTITHAKAFQMFRAVLEAKNKWINGIIPEAAGAKLTKEQRIAIMSFAYNIAPGAFIGKLAYIYLKAGRIDLAIPRLKLYTNGGLAGLVRRRNCENLLLTGTSYQELKKRRYLQ